MFRHFTWLAGAAAATECSPPWSYSDFSKWDALGMCNHKDDQSPINIEQDGVVAMSEPLEISSGDAEKSFLVLNEHTWEVDFVDSPTTLTFKGRKYGLKQFHFHAPSEHTIDGKHFDMEMHNVFADPETNQNLVVGVFLSNDGASAGPHQSYFDSFWQHFPTEDGKKPAAVADPFKSLLKDPASAAYYHYTGSLTTPPCTNNTEWILIQEPLVVDAAFVDGYRKGINEPACTQLAQREQPAGVAEGWDLKLGVNNRNLQSLGGRTIQSYQPAAAAKEQASGFDYTKPLAAVVVVGIILAVWMKQKSSARETKQELYVNLA